MSVKIIDTPDNNQMLLNVYVYLTCRVEYEAIVTKWNTQKYNVNNLFKFSIT